jgi:hypothetical protein
VEPISTYNLASRTKLSGSNQATGVTKLKSPTLTRLLEFNIIRISYFDQKLQEEEKFIGIRIIEIV